jgi:hypothetical protein
VRKHLFDLAVLFGFVSIAAISIALARPSVQNLTLHAYVLVVGALIMLAVVAAARDAVPKRHRSEFDRALTDAVRRDEPPHEVAQIERKVTLGAATAYDLHVRLLPQLRQIAQARLERTGRPMSPETLGRWWELLRPDGPMPADRHAPGISPSDLRDLVSDLERM